MQTVHGNIDQCLRDYRHLCDRIQAEESSTWLKIRQRQLEEEIFSNPELSPRLLCIQARILSSWLENEEDDHSETVRNRYLVRFLRDALNYLETAPRPPKAPHAPEAASNYYDLMFGNCPYR